MPRARSSVATALEALKHFLDIVSIAAFTLMYALSYSLLAYLRNRLPLDIYLLEGECLEELGLNCWSSTIREPSVQLSCCQEQLRACTSY